MPETEKTYVKKYKINDMLNDLFTALSQNKPENPLEFAIKHLESKLPSKSDSNEENSKKSRTLASAPPPISDPSQTALDSGTDLLMKLMSRKKIHSENEAVASSATTGGDGLSPLVKLGLMNKMNRIIVKTSKEKTPEEMLESENIVFISKNKDEIEDEAKEKPKNIVTSYSKDKLKSRDADLKRKETIRNLIDINLKRLEEAESSQTYESKSDDNQPEHISVGLEENEMEELSEEILTSSNYHNVKERKKKKNEEKKRIISQRANLNQSLFAARDRMAAPAPPLAVQLVICQFCSKAQNLLNKSENTLLNEPNNTARLASNAQSIIPPLDINKENEPAQIGEKDDETKKTIFDFFKAIKSSEKLPEFSQETQRTKKTETFDDDNIESASQVSGPRPITPYDPPTSRTIVKDLDSERDAPKEPGVLGWVMTRQRLDEKEAASRNQSFEKQGSIQQQPSSSIGSPRTKIGDKLNSPAGSQLSRASASKRPSESLRKQTSDASSVQQQQQWKGKETSSESSLNIKKL